MRDVEKLWSAGFALGASLENTVAIGDDGIINPEGLRYADEFVRHKILDAVGDLALAGFPLLGTYRSYCGGHRLNFAVLEALFSNRSNYAIVEAATRRETGYAEIGNGIAVPGLRSRSPLTRGSAAERQSAASRRPSPCSKLRRQTPECRAWLATPWQ